MASAAGETKRILIKSVITGNYARPIDEERYNGYLSADGKGDPRMYLEEWIIPLTSGLDWIGPHRSGFYRIKSGDTNKYWQVKSPENPWITADADPDSHAADPKRTMFQIECFVRPITPVAPITPVIPVAPITPVIPDAPITPVAPIAPVIPDAPITPVAPIAPVIPVAPVTHTTIRLRHAYLNSYACLYGNQDYPYCLKLSDKPNEDSNDVFVCEKFP